MRMDFEWMHNKVYLNQMKIQIKFKSKFKRRLEANFSEVRRVHLSVKPTPEGLHSSVRSDQRGSEMMYTPVKLTFLRKSMSVHSHNFHTKIG